MRKIVLAALTTMLAAASIFTATATANAAPYCGITWGSLPKSGGVMSTAPITNIRTGQHDCYDRMVFDFSGSASGYRVQYVDNVYADPSGLLIPLKGGAKLQIVALAPTYNSSGVSTYPGVVGQPLPGVNLTGYQTFRDAKFAGSFEGQTTVGLGVRARLPFRVFTLDNRLVVDVAHHW
ncbi:MAG TPA: hypothetical protein VLG11_00805 [Candidatus Saccharimonadales bacterium]|nr:hypothetical protein [Candidatus Saccharimonadales bacterium]